MSQPRTNDATPVSTPPSLQNDYLFIREIGHGGQAKVFLAIRLADNRHVSVKQLNIESVKTWKEYDLFHREADVLSKLNIDGIAKFYCAIECLQDDPPCSYIVQKFVEGASLDRMLASGHRFKTSEVFDILLQLLAILKQLHSQQPPVIHRDIKPSNIMITPDNGRYRVTLIDFGAVANPQVQSGGSTVAGTYGYMPPEQLMGRPEPASDIYSLAAVAVELFSGKSPAQMPNKDFRLIFEPDVQQLHPSVVGTLRSMLEPKIENRLKDIDEITRMFEQYRDNQFINLASSALSLDHSRKVNMLLGEVESVGSPGNVDIWQMLSESVPRPVPETIISKSNEILEQIRQPHTKKIIGKLSASVYKHLLLIIYLAFLATVFFYMNIVGSVSAITLFMLLVFASIGCLISYLSSYNPDTNAQKKKDNHASTDAVQQMIDLITKGRKTIATIESIDYIPASFANIRWIRDIQYIESAPKFRIKYKFNPPDDLCEEDLLHEYIAHTDPETNYHVGDPLPILYLIEKHYFGETVVSMPYPFPLADTDCRDLVFNSEAYGTDTAISTKEIENRKDYKSFLKPILEASNDDVKLIDALTLAQMITDSDVLNVMLQFGTQRILQHNKKTLREVYFNRLSMIPDYSHDDSKKHLLRDQIQNYLLMIARKQFPKVSPNLNDLPALFGNHHPFTLDFTREYSKAAVQQSFLFHKNVDSRFARNTNLEILELVNNRKRWLDMAEEQSASLFVSVYQSLISAASRRIQINDPSVLTIDVKDAAVDNSKYEYTNHLAPVLSHLNDPNQLIQDFKHDLWLIDDLDIAQKIILIGKENVWPTTDAELRVAYIKMIFQLIKCSDKEETRSFLIRYTRCFFAGLVPDVKPCLNEFNALREFKHENQEIKAFLSLFEDPFLCETK